MLLTAPRNLPTPGRRQPLYVVFSTLQRPVFLVNSRLGLFTATLSRSQVLVLLTITGYLFSRSYEVILPSSLARVISRTLVFPTYQPLAVYGTVACYSHLRSFSWQCGFNTFRSVDPPHHASRLNAVVDFPATTSYTLTRPLPFERVSLLLRPYPYYNE